MKKWYYEKEKANEKQKNSKVKEGIVRPCISFNKEGVFLI